MFFKTKECKNNIDEKKLRYDAISTQIAREDDLAGKRLTWIITINGFLFASLSFLVGGKDLDSDFTQFFKNFIPFMGLTISISGLCGVIAAYCQIYYLVDQWEQLNDERWPRPFGDKKASFILGVLPSILPPIILSVMWFYLSWSY